MKKTLIFITLLLLGIMINAADKVPDPGKLKANVTKKPVRVENIADAIKLLKDAEASKRPIPASSIAKVIELLKNAEIEKNTKEVTIKNPASVSDVTELIKRLGRLEKHYKTNNKIYRDGVIEDITFVFASISNGVAILTVCVAVFTVVVVIFQIFSLKGSKDQVTKSIRNQNVKIAKDLYRVKSETEKINDEMKKEITRIDKEARENKCIASIGFARIICEFEDNESEKRRSIKELATFMDEFKDNISLFNAKARLHKRVGEYNEAIEVIDIYLNNVKYSTLNINQKRDCQIDVFLYNKACYTALLNKPKRTEDYKTTVLNLLEEAISLNKKLVEDAKNDSDFDFFKKTYKNEFDAVLKA